MNQRDKIIFINDLMNNVKTDIIEKVPAMPEEWDGHELRQYIYDAFSLSLAVSSYMTNKKSKRYRTLSARTQAHR